MNKFTLLVMVSSLLVGCSSTEKECEELAEVNKQVQQCQALQQKMTAAKGQPVRLQELERRFQIDCVDSRFYKDSYEKKTCKAKNN